MSSVNLKTIELGVSIWKDISKEYISFMNKLLSDIIKNNKEVKFLEFHKTICMSLSLFLLKRGFTNFKNMFEESHIQLLNENMDVCLTETKKKEIYDKLVNSHVKSLKVNTFEYLVEVLEQ